MLASTAYRTYSSKENGRRNSLVLIHGLGLNQKIWNDYLEVLSKEYYVVTYDLAGHGDSKPFREDPNLTLFADQLIDLLDELNIKKASLVGFSLGGMINRKTYLLHPERMDSLVILNSPHQRSPEAQRKVEERVDATAAGGPKATLNSTIERWFTPSYREEFPEQIEVVKNWLLKNDPEVYTQTRRVLAHGVKELIDPDPPISIPTLLMTCENDSGSTPAMSEAIAKEIEGARVKIVPKLQHMGLMEQPEIFNETILNFLKNN